VLSTSFSHQPTSHAAEGVGERPFLSEHTREWAKMAMDALIGKTYA